MNLIHCFTKPYFVFRPGQVFRRLTFEFATNTSDRRDVKLPWGFPLRVDPADDIGRALLTTGVNDLLVTEALFRLVDAGDFAIDVGANIGYMTSVMASRVGATGRVLSFEPHPVICRELQTHVKAWEDNGLVAPAVIETVKAAVSARPGEATLVEPPTFKGNRGRSALETAVGGSSGEPSSSRHKTAVESLDTFLLTGSQVGMLKIDVEGHEEQVLLGASALLTRQAIRDIVFEEFASYPAATHRLLASFGYKTFAMEERLTGPRLHEPHENWPRPRYAPPNFIATRDEERLHARFRARGWRCLSSRGKEAPLAQRMS
jgi:FkbM family methyltransferase